MFMHRDDLIAVFEKLIIPEDKELVEKYRKDNCSAATAYSYGFIAGKNEGIQTVIDLLKKAKPIKKDE